MTTLQLLTSVPDASEINEAMDWAVKASAPGSNLSGSGVPYVEVNRVFGALKHPLLVCRHGIYPILASVLAGHRHVILGGDIRRHLDGDYPRSELQKNFVYGALSPASYRFHRSNVFTMHKRDVRTTYFGAWRLLYEYAGYEIAEVQDVY